MVKILCVVLLLALTCQLQLSMHAAFIPDNLVGKSFKITDSSLNSLKVTGRIVKFADGTISFNMACGQSTASYTLAENGGITISSDWKLPANCRLTEFDPKIQENFNKVNKYSFNLPGSILTLSNGDT